MRVVGVRGPASAFAAAFAYCRKLAIDFLPRAMRRTAYLQRPTGGQQARSYQQASAAASSIKARLRQKLRATP